MRDTLASWSTTPPTEPGWYWARGVFRVTVDESQEIISIVHVDEFDSGLEVYSAGTEIPDDISDYTNWIGPLLIPSSPV